VDLVDVRRQRGGQGVNGMLKKQLAEPMLDIEALRVVALGTR
jgi:hypothetical protein